MNDCDDDDDADTGGASQGDPNDSLTEEDCREGSGKGTAVHLVPQSDAP